MVHFTPDDFNRIQNLYSQLIVTANQSSATANCNIHIGKISGTLNSNCVINIRNICRVGQDSLSLLDVAVHKILDIKTDTNTADLLTVYNSLRQECVAQSAILQAIGVQDLDLGICSPNIKTTFNFTNSGDAVSNCLVTSLLRLTENEVTMTENNFVSLIQDNFLMIVAGLVCGGLLSILMMFLGRKKITIVWRKT